MTERHDEDELWRSIVENYGDRPQLDDDPADPGATATVDQTEVARFPEVDEDQSPIEDVAEERFVPPPVPPVPRPAAKRLLAWAGLFGVPLVLLVCLVFSIDLPRLAAYAGVAWFVGGFGYLVWTMPRGPRDPFDDGARL